MSPKKPGTDLAALKARLAKKTKAAKPAPASVPPPGQVAAPAQPVIPAPGQVSAPPPEPPPQPRQAQVPPPGHVAEPPPPAMPDLPPPGQQMPVQQPVAYDPGPSMSRPAADVDDPFGGGPAGNFDPSAGVIMDSSSEGVPSRGGKGLVIFVALLFAAIGGVVGFLVLRISGGSERVKIGKEKGTEMLTEVQQVSGARKAVSVAFEDLQKKSKGDPSGAATDIKGLLKENFDKHPKVEALFGWQLGNVHPSGIKRTFELYEHANRINMELGYLASYLEDNKATLMGGGGPKVFGVTFKTDGAVMVAALPMCGVDPAALDQAKPCPPSDFAKAIAYKVFEKAGKAGKVLPRGKEPGQATLLLTEGDIYAYAIGTKPENNTRDAAQAMFKRLKDRLDKMSRAERVAISALTKFVGDPNIDGSSPPPDPEEAAGEGE